MIRVIKRYESRKLYDTEESRYISLEDIAQWVRDGQEVQVIDNSTSEDVTSQILTQIILEGGKRGTSFLPQELLHDLVRGGERMLSTGVEQVQGSVDRLVRGSIDRLGPVRRARSEMGKLRQRLDELEETLKALERDSGNAPAPARPPSTKKPAAKKASTKAAAPKTAKKAAPKTKTTTRRPRKAAAKTESSVS